MKPAEFGERVAELLKDCQGGWEEDLDEQPILRGFYVCADYGDFEGHSIFFALAADGNGEGRVSPWAVRGYLKHALDTGMLGLADEDEDGDE